MSWRRCRMLLANLMQPLVYKVLQNMPLNSLKPLINYADIINLCVHVLGVPKCHQFFFCPTTINLPFKIIDAYI